MTAEIFHLTTPQAWAAAQHSGVVAPPSLRDEGFVHCSTREQLTGTIERHFGAADDLLLLHLDEASVGDALRWEHADSGMAFPHVYRPLSVSEVRRVTAWHRSPDGSVALPPEVT